MIWLKSNFGKRQRLAFLLCGLLLFWFVLVILAWNTPTSFDEDQHIKYGRLVLSIIHNQTPWDELTKLADLRYYGALVDIIGSFIETQFPKLDPFKMRHVVYATFGFFAILSCGTAAYLAFDFATAFTATTLITLTPAFLGHSLMNPKDPAFAFFYILLLLSLVGLFQNKTKPAFIWFVALGTAIGGLLGMRPGGVIAGPVILSVMPFYWRTIQQYFARFVSGFIVAIAIALAICIAVWPWLWHEPIAHFMEALHYQSAFPIPLRLLYFGTSVDSTNLPWHYPLLMLVLTVPILHLATIVLGMIHPFRSGIVIFALGAWLPLIIAIAVKANVYDGYRHFLFTLPPLAIIASRGLIFLRHCLMQFKCGVILFCTLVALGFSSPLLHYIGAPRYLYAYFNEFIGSNEGAYGEFDIDYWGLCVEEAVNQIRDLTGTAPVSIRVNPFAEHLAHIAARNDQTITIENLSVSGDYTLLLLKGIDQSRLPTPQVFEHIGSIAINGAPVCLVTKGAKKL